MTHAHVHDVDASARGRAFTLAIALNVIIVVVEAIFGWRANSLALLSDAGHNLTELCIVCAFPNPSTVAR